MRLMLLVVAFAAAARAQGGPALIPADAHPRFAAPERSAHASVDVNVDGDVDVNGDGDEGDDESEVDSERDANAPAGPDRLYSNDLSDAELARRWKDDLPALGSISVGFADEGRLINGVHMGEDPAWTLQRPDLAWGAKETVEALRAAFRAVHARFADSAPARLSHIGAQEGGYLRPHRSHQSGRDADIGFFYKTDSVPHGRARREKLIDLARNWALLRALITSADVQVVLTDRGIQKVLRKYAVESGEDPEWVDSLFRGGRQALVQHARRHRDHFHVRFFAPRSQELGRRIQPLLALRPEQNLAVHRVKPGQTLGHIAKKYGCTVALLQKANKLRTRTLLRVGQRVLVPLRKPCTRCPLPPPVVVPPRRLPPGVQASAKSEAGAAMGATR